MVGSFEIHPLEKPKADSSNMLSNEDRINPNVSPIERLRAMDKDTYEEVVAVWAYCCVRSEGYQAVNRVGGADDKGRVLIRTMISLICINVSIIKIEFGTAERYGLFYE